MREAQSENVIETAERVRDLFLRPGKRLPRQILTDEVCPAGFADEVLIRQSPEFYEALKRFMSASGEVSLFFLWLDSHIPRAEGLTVIAVEAMDKESNLVDIQTQISEEVLAGGDSWLVAPLSGRWAIYGEHFGSEMSLFIAQDRSVLMTIRRAFGAFLLNARDASSELRCQHTTPAGDEFARQLVHNYPD